MVMGIHIRTCVHMFAGCCHGNGFWYFTGEKSWWAWGDRKEGGRVSFTFHSSLLSTPSTNTSPNLAHLA